MYGDLYVNVIHSNDKHKNYFVNIRFNFLEYKLKGEKKFMKKTLYDKKYKYTKVKCAKNIPLRYEK